MSQYGIKTVVIKDHKNSNLHFDLANKVKEIVQKIGGYHALTNDTIYVFPESHKDLKELGKLLKKCGIKHNAKWLGGEIAPWSPHSWR